MGSQGGGQQSHVQPLARQNSWYSLTLDEVGNQLRDLGKPLGSMNLDELLNNIWMAEANQSTGKDVENASLASYPQRQASLTLARALSGKTIDEVWRDIQLGQKKRFGEEMKVERELTLGDMTLEDFLVKAGVFAEASFGPELEFDIVDGLTPPHMGLSPSTSIGTLSDTTTSGRKRNAPDALDRTVERRLKRKIKNRESAARSRARKQVGFQFCHFSFGKLLLLLLLLLLFFVYYFVFLFWFIHDLNRSMWQCTGLP